MRVRISILQTIDIEVDDQTDFQAYRQEVLGNLEERYSSEEARSSGTPEEILLTTMEDVTGHDGVYQAMTLNVEQV